MPIKIAECENPSNEFVWLCDDDWELPTQLSVFEEWLRDNASKMDKGNYYADIGFSPREDAAGGGAVLSIESMKSMIKVGIELHLSKYPPFVEDSNE